MTRQIGLFMAGVLFCAQGALAQPAERKDLQVFNDISKTVNRYAYFTVFDDVRAEVNGGVVTLDGKVTMPYKKDDIGKRVAKVDGVTRVVSRIEVLPTSTWDDQLRYRIARAIYGNPHFWNYGASANPSIHIIVERGRITLTGAADSEVQKSLAATLAQVSGSLGVTNRIRVDRR